MIILDTNVLSALMRQSPDIKVVRWLDRQPRTSLWTTVITVLEVRFGLLALPQGKRRVSLTHAFEKLLAAMNERVAPFETEAANAAAELMATRQRTGRIVELRDTMIAGIVLSQRASLATRNTKHFDDTSISLINPWSM